MVSKTSLKNKKYIILIYFQVNIMKNNIYYNLKHHFSLFIRQSKN